MPKIHDSGGSGHQRGGRGRRVSSSLAEINVVPLVDVMLVLLIIFMVTAPMIQRGIDVNLPVARRAATVEGERLFVTVPTTYHSDGLVYIGQERVSAGSLAGRLKENCLRLFEGGAAACRPHFRRLKPNHAAQATCRRSIAFAAASLNLSASTGLTR